MKRPILPPKGATLWWIVVGCSVVVVEVIGWVEGWEVVSRLAGELLVDG